MPKSPSPPFLLLTTRAPAPFCGTKSSHIGEQSDKLLYSLCIEGRQLNQYLTAVLISSFSSQMYVKETIIAIYYTVDSKYVVFDRKIPPRTGAHSHCSDQRDDSREGRGNQRNCERERRLYWLSGASHNSRRRGRSRRRGGSEPASTLFHSGVCYPIGPLDQHHLIWFGTRERTPQERQQHTTG